MKVLQLLFQETCVTTNVVIDRDKKLLRRDEAGADKKKFSLQNLLTFGKKKGDLVIKRLTVKDIVTGADISMEGKT